MNHLNAVPPLGHETRTIYEVAHQAGDRLKMATAELDRKIELLQRFSMRFEDVPDLEDEINSIAETIAETLAEAEATGEGNWVDHFRLLSHYALLKEIIHQPSAFSAPDRYEQRHDLVNGIYGVCGSVIAVGLDQYDTPHAYSQEAEHIKGALHEQTLLALLNRSQSRSRMALPGSLRQDLSQKTDIVYHMYIGKNHGDVDIQVKGAFPRNPENATPPNGLLFAASNFGNLNLATSRAIVAELNGTATQEDIARLDHYTEYAEKRCRNKIIQNIDRSDAPSRYLLRSA